LHCLVRRVQFNHTGFSEVGFDRGLAVQERNTVWPFRAVPCV
jgi:hypothetical protein